MFCPRCATDVPESNKFCPSCGMDVSTITEIAKEKKPAEPTELELVRDALGDEYEITDQIGRGGMAIVFKATDLNLEREVAIKVLPLSMAYDEEFVQRFQREAKTAAKLEHPNIIPIHRVGKSGRIIFFVMKFLKGRSLGDLLDEKGRIPPAEIKRIIREAGGALGYAHANGVVHRDIKPDNIVFDEIGRPIVTDFGIAKAATGTRLTGTGMAIGTPYYMSPEQARAQKLDGRSDIYSLGVLAYQCLCGHLPFEGDDSFAVGIKHISEELPIPELHGEEQQELFKVIQKMLAKDPADRYQTIEEVLADLGAPHTPVEMPVATQSFAEKETQISAAKLAAASTPTTPMPMHVSAADAGPGREKKKMSGALMAVLGVLVIGGGGILVLSTMRGGDEGSDASTSDAGQAVSDSSGQEIIAADSTADSTEAVASAQTSDSTAAASDAGVPVASAVGAGQTTERQATPRSGQATPQTRNRPAGQTPRAQQPSAANTAETRWNRRVRNRLQQASAELTEQGWETVGNPRIGQVGRGGTEDFEAALENGFEYMFVGICDDRCDDVDLILYSPRNREIDSDYAVDQTPIVQVRTRAAGTHRVRVSMADCSTRSCYYAVSMYRRTPQARRGGKR